MKDYTKRMFLCIKKLKMSDGEVDFKKDKVYLFTDESSTDGVALVDEQGYTHWLGSWIKHFIEIKPKHAKKSLWEKFLEDYGG